MPVATLAREHEILDSGFFIESCDRLALATETERWFALVIRPRHEKAAEQFLNSRGFDTFLPLHIRSHRYGSRLREYQLPLFPGYLFCRVVPDSLVRVLNAPSVLQVVGVGREPAPIEQKEMESLRIAAAASVRMTEHPYPELGRTVRVVSGPLTGVEGVVVETKGSFRLVLSLTMLQRSVAVELDRAQVVVE